MSKKHILPLAAIGLLLLLFSFGCGGGSLSGQPATGWINLNIQAQARYIPPDIDSFLVKILSRVSGESVLPDIAISYPDTSAVIGNVPPGPLNVVVLARNFSLENKAYGIARVTVQEGLASTVELTLVPGSGRWILLQPVLYATPYRQAGVFKQFQVDGSFINPYRLDDFSAAFTPPYSDPEALPDLGPGGETVAMEYSFADSGPLGWVSLLGRGSGSFFNKGIALREGSETGTYNFDINQASVDLDYPHSYLPVPVIQQPLPSAQVNLSQPLTVSWQDLGAGYGYLVEAFHTYSASQGEKVADYYWSSLDLREVSYNDPRTLVALVNSLPDSNQVVIPAGTFPTALTFLELRVTAFAKNQVRAELDESNLGLAVMPWSVFAIYLNPVVLGPYITQLTPSSANPGDQITIAGTNFGNSQGTSTLTVGGVDAGNAAAWSNTRIICTVPANAQTGYLIVRVGPFDSNPYPLTVTRTRSLNLAKRESYYEK